MNKEELHETILKNDGKEMYFSFASEEELDYFLEFFSGSVDEIRSYVNVPKSELVLDVEKNRLYDWGRISDSFYKEKIIHHLDFSTREEENIKLNVQINEYTGKLLIPFEALQQLKQGAKLKLL